MNFKSNKRKSTFLNFRKYFSLILAMCLWGIQPHISDAGSIIAQGQNTRIAKGVILDENGESLIGVNVMEKGTTNGTITDLDGRFQLRVANASSVLEITYVGYTTKEVTVGTSDLRIQLSPDAQLIDEVVVIGYATQNKRTVVGAVAQASGEALKSKGTMGNLSDALSGTIPGVTVMTKSGAPGGGGEHGEATAILIRGMNTWNNAQPLVLVDGMERSMNDISIDEIETFSVLKDASATAIFGVKGGNGVILITTKRGQTGKAKVTAEVNFSSKSLSRVEKSLNSYEGLMARNLAIIHEMPLFGQNNMALYTSPRVLGYFPR
jgi:TonB-dependent SusC/RagA subfamily outer membrane receptor